MIVVDTSVWIDFFRGKESAQHKTMIRLIEEEEDLALTEIIFMKILQGITQDKDFRKVKEFLMDFPIYQPKGLETYINAAQIFRNCRKKGKTVRKTIDCIISAICIESNLLLLHNDKDFNFIEACSSLKCYKNY